MTFNSVGLSDDGFEFVDGSIIDTTFNNTPYPEITLEAIIIPTIVDDNFHMFFGNYVGSGEYVNMYLDNSNKLRIQTRDKNNVITVVQSDFSVEAGIEYHVMGIIDNDSMYMYVNGEKQVEIETVEIQQYSTHTMTLGAQNYLTPFQFYGNMKLASIYNRALTAQEALDSHNEVTFNVE
jgi:hypothetical protein